MRAVLALALAIGLATTAVPSTAQQGAEGLKLGVLTDMSGPAATNTGPGSVTAAKMAVEDFGGAMFGRPIEVISGDFLLKVDTGVALARNWFDRENVDAI